jgi:hypothetical protein
VDLLINVGTKAQPPVELNVFWRRFVPIRFQSCPIFEDATLLLAILKRGSMKWWKRIEPVTAKSAVDLFIDGGAPASPFAATR